jgi:hypothetical protein
VFRKKYLYAVQQKYELNRSNRRRLCPRSPGPLPRRSWSVSLLDLRIFGGKRTTHILTDPRLVSKPKQTLPTDTRETPQLTISANPFLSQQWYQLDKSDVQSASSGGFLIWILFRQRLHLSLWCVSDSVASNLNRSRSSATLKCRSASSLLSTTVELNAFLWACLWKIFSSMEPACNQYCPSRSVEATKTHRQEPVDVAGFLLAVPPDPRHGLVVVGRVPVRVEHDQSIGPDQVQAAAPGFRAQHEDKLLRFWIVEAGHHFGPLLDAHAAVEAHVQVAPLPAQLLEEVEGLGVIRDQNDLVVVVGFQIGQETVQKHELAGELGHHVFVAVIGGEELARVFETFAAFDDFVHDQVRVVAQFFQRGYAGKRAQRSLHFHVIGHALANPLRVYVIQVDLFLQRSQLTDNDHFEFDRQIFRQKVRSAPDQTPVDQIRKFLQTIQSSLSLCIRGGRVLPPEDVILEFSLELLGAPQQPLVDKMNQTKILQEVVLNGGPTQQHSPLGLQPHQGPVRLILAVLQPVTLVAKHQPYLPAVQNRGVHSERLVRNDQNRDGGAPLTLHELSQFFLSVGAPIHYDRVQTAFQPLVDFVAPVPDQRAGTHDYTFLDGGLALGALPHQSPQQGDALKSLPEPHFVRHYAPVGPRDLDTRHAIIHELDPLQTTLTNPFRQFSKVPHADGAGGCWPKRGRRPRGLVQDLLLSFFRAGSILGGRTGLERWEYSGRTTPV